jgi:hypothetical protein
VAIHHHAHDCEELCEELDALALRIEMIETALFRIEMMVTPPVIPEPTSELEKIDEAIDEHEHGTHDHEERQETEDQIEEALEEHREEEHGEEEHGEEASSDDDAIVVDVSDSLPDDEEEESDEETVHQVPFAR